MFDEQNLVSSAGLVPVLELAEQTGLSQLIGEQVDLPSTRVKSGAVNPAGKLTSIIAAMMCGADSIDDAGVLRAGGTPAGVSTRCMRRRRWGSSCASSPSAMPTSWPRWPARIWWRWRAHPLLPGIEQRAFVDIDSLLRPVYGHHKQGASFGHAKIAGRALLRLGPVPADHHALDGDRGAGDRRGVAARRQDRLRARRPPGRSSRPSPPPARAGPAATIMLRGDSAFGTKKVIAACLDEGVEFSLVGEPKQTHHHRDRGHRRGRLHPGALPRRGRKTPTPAR